jgi:hypothetical protein
VFPPLKHEGFEWLYAELLVMMGDEAYTSAFASRFDLAGMNLQSFQGSLFEPGGMDLAGGAGYEMFNLYLSTQYYQMALDRFYAMSPYLWQALKAPDRNFVSINTVEDYFARLIRASTQKSRAFSEIAKRYQSFNRSDLARRVAERGYATAYLEDVILSRMLLGVVATADPQARDYIRKRADLAALGYKAALLDMRDVYRTLTEQVTYFGFAPDYIPFPALGPGDVNAFTKLLAGAEKSVGVAAEKEILALNASTSYETDSALFEQELVRLRNNYENQLADLCGTFTGSDGLVHPAIRAYAYLDERAGTFGDPCGLMGTGQLNEAMGRLETIGVDLKSVRQQYTDVLAAIDIERQRVAQQCGLTQKLADFKIKQAQKTKTIGDVIAETQDFIGEINGTLEKVGKVANLMKCAVGTSSDCASAAAAMSYYLSWDGICDVAMQEAQKLIEQKKDEIAVVEQESVKIESQQPCATAQVDSEAAIRKEHLKLAELDLQTLKTQYELRLAAAEIRGLRDKATRLQAEMEEMEQQTINVEAARNDPNVRIYKNDAILTADRTFQDALKAVYRATKVFEYYTSQSYARLDSLFLVRMVSHGDYSLEGYLSDLEKAYYDFQELYGNPDVRVEVLSLRDDVLSVPRLDADGAPRTQAARVDDLRKALADPGRLDESGFVRLPFSTTRSRLSPLTRNHKILRLEAEMIGSDIGDTVGRLYVAQVGTGTVVGVDGASEYYRFPERTAVLNPFFNGVRVYSPDVYTNDHLRDRPLLNTHWDLVINQKDEAANQDINLQSLTDVRLYIYYTDFTQF